MTDKYYTPLISEFHVGFIYEIGDDSGGWEKRVFTEKDLISKTGLHMFSVILNTQPLSEFKGGLRVKYLDRQDIEDEGWVMESETMDGLMFKMVGIDLRNEPPRGIYTLIFTRTGWVLISQQNTPRFSGTLKNKSELHKLMIQTGIIK